MKKQTIVAMGVRGKRKEWNTRTEETALQLAIWDFVTTKISTTSDACTHTGNERNAPKRLEGNFFLTSLQYY